MFFVLFNDIELLVKIDKQWYALCELNIVFTFVLHICSLSCEANRIRRKVETSGKLIIDTDFKALFNLIPLISVAAYLTCLKWWLDSTAESCSFFVAQGYPVVRTQKGQRRCRPFSNFFPLPENYFFVRSSMRWEVHKPCWYQHIQKCCIVTNLAKEAKV